MFSSECRDALGVTLFDRLTWRPAVQGAQRCLQEREQGPPTTRAQALVQLEDAGPQDGVELPPWQSISPASVAHRDHPAVRSPRFDCGPSNPGNVSGFVHRHHVTRRQARCEFIRPGPQERRSLLGRDVGIRASSHSGRLWDGRLAVGRFSPLAASVFFRPVSRSCAA